MTEGTQAWMQVASSGAISLVAAFAGAYFAFALQNRSAANQRKSRHLSASLAALFALIRTLNFVSSFRTQFIDPVRSERLRYISMRPILAQPETLHLEWSELTFLLPTAHANVLNQISVAQSRYHVLVSAIQTRSHQVLTNVQPALARAGVKDGPIAIREESLEELLGHDTCVSLRRLTDDIISFADESDDELFKLTQDFRLALLSLYPDADVPGFQLNDDGDDA